MFVDEHIKYLKSCVDQKEESWKSPAIQSWAKYVVEHYASNRLMINLNILPEGSINREQIHRFVATENNKLMDCVSMICAWGGMNREHGAKAFSNWSEWSFIPKDIRAGEINREQAYAEFAKARSEGVLKGMGPAYFTKLIFFLSPKKDGYIMDQWTARSINLLLEKPMVILDKSRFSQRVSDRNCSGIYERFCQSLENLSNVIGIRNHEETEMLIFSNGRGKGRWRNYVKQVDRTWTP